jgi:hypothetical protein
MYYRSYSGKNNEEVTDLLSHDGWAAQGLTDAQMVINSCEFKDEVLPVSK